MSNIISLHGPTETQGMVDAARAIAINRFFEAAKHKSREETIRERARVLALAIELVDANRPTISVRNVVSVTADFYGYTIPEFQSPRRVPALADARHVAMYLAFELTGATRATIGVPLGNRDPSTVYHGHRKVARLLASGDEKLTADIAAIKQLLGVSEISPKNEGAGA